MRSDGAVMITVIIITGVNSEAGAGGEGGGAWASVDRLLAAEWAPRVADGPTYPPARAHAGHFPPLYTHDTYVHPGTHSTLTALVG